MIDENLPIFYYKAPKDSVKQDATIYVQQYDDSSPVYTLRYPDPNSPDARNRYAIALYDCYNPDVLYGEVLVVPDWAQGSQTAEDQRRTPGAPARPEPTLPSKCTIQLYNPDQQIVLEHHPSKWNASETWEFSLPMETFRQPSSSALDHGRSDPAVLEETPVIPMKWKRGGKVSKDITCYLSGETRNPDGSKKKHKEPDIPLAFFKSLKEITLYEPNLTRVDIEDPKGFEVILLLGATLIRDVYHGSLQHAFNVSEGPYRRSSGEGRTAHQPPPPATLNKPAAFGAAAGVAATAVASPPPHGPYSGHPPPSHANATVPPPTDPRTQWEIDSETARLRKATEREQRHAEEQRRKEEKKNAKAAQKIAEEEERAARARQAAVDAETARLKQQYGKNSGHHQAAPPLPPRQPAAAMRPPPSPKPDKKKDKKDRQRLDKPHQHSHSAAGYHVPSVPSSSFLSPHPPHSAGFAPQRPVSASGFGPLPGPGWHGPPQPGWHGPPPPQGHGPPPPGWGPPPPGWGQAPPMPPRPRSVSDVGHKKGGLLDRFL